MIDDDTIMRSNLSKLVRLTRRRDLLTSDESERERREVRRVHSKGVNRGNRARRKGHKGQAPYLV